MQCTPCVSCVLSENKGKALLYLTQESKTLPQPEVLLLLLSEVKTTANMHHRCHSCIIDIVALAKKNTTKTFEAIKSWSLTAPKIASWAADKEKQTNKNITINIMSRLFPKYRNKKQNRKCLTESTFYKVQLIHPQQISKKMDNLKKKEIPQHVSLKHIQLYWISFKNLVFSIILLILGSVKPVAPKTGLFFLCQSWLELTSMLKFLMA